MSSYLVRSAESLLRGIHQVEEAILVHLFSVQLRHWHGDRGEVGVVDKEEEGLGGVELQPAPDDLDELAHGDVVGDQELGLVQHRQLLLPPEPLDDQGTLAGCSDRICSTSFTLNA